ncbi:MAG: GntR family transcriptional regulator [Clostridia bacterium]|nr:GntR family transcriptional regulator [Clostridia bacterium]
MNTYTPAYIKIQDYILDKINTGLWQPGYKIPSENELSRSFNVSRGTVNSAIKELSTMGIVERVRGKGTFVKHNLSIKDNISYVFSKPIKISSLGSKKHSLVKINIIEANEEINDKFYLLKNEKIYEVIRTMHNNNTPIGIDYSYIPMSTLLNKPINPNDLDNTYLHVYLRDFLEIKLKYLHIHINTRLPNDYELKLLGVEHNNPLLIWNTDIVDDNQKTIAFTTTVALPDQYRPFIKFEI